MTHAGLSHGKISFMDVLPFDQHHYNGIPEVDDVISRLGITAGANIINIGSGLGGPARYIAGKTGCKVSFSVFYGY